MVTASRIRATGGTSKLAPSLRQRSSASVDEDKPEFEPSKIVKLRAACTEHGWDMYEDWFGDNYRVKAWRNDGEERLYLIWRDRYFSAEESYYELVEVRKKRVSNQAEAIRWVKDTPDYTHSKEIVRDVFDWSDHTDEEVEKSLAGRKITWQNSYTGEHETAVLPRRGYWTSVQRSSVNRRFITFADAAGTGFRSVGLDAITRIK